MAGVETGSPRNGGGRESRGHRSTTRVFDWFVIVNLSLFLAATGSVFLSRFVHLRGEGHLGEFGIYAVICMVVVLAAWRTLRRFDWPLWLLVAAEMAILIHFAGGLIPYQDGRFYDIVLCGIRFDKYVHWANSFIAALVVSHLTRRGGLAVVLMVLGLGALWEIVEYAVVSRIPDAGVGLYDNNLRDLVANLAGGLTWWLMSAVVDALRRSVPGRTAGRKGGEA